MDDSRAARAARALAHLPERDPALAALALWCDMQDGAGSRTETSGDVICVGADVAKMPLREQIGVIGRHVLHVALRHEATMSAMAQRRGDAFDAGLFALCAEAYANECLLRGGHALPRPAVRLSEMLEIVMPRAPGSGDEMLSTWEPERLYQRIVEGSPEESERCHRYAIDRGFHPALRPAAPDPDAGRKALAWRAHLLRARQGGGGAGRGIGQVLRYLEERPVSRMPWEQRLRGLMTRSLAEVPHQSWQRPRSAWIAAEADARASGRPRPVFQPALRRRSPAPRIVVGLDTSSSIGAGMLARLAAEVTGIMRRTGAETHALCFDEEVYHSARLDPLRGRGALDDIALRRDGGTCFVDLMHRADALSPSVIVVLSDAVGDFGKRPRAPVIWASPVPLRRPPPYGEVIDLIG